MPLAEARCLPSRTRHSKTGYIAQSERSTQLATVSYRYG